MPRTLTGRVETLLAIAVAVSIVHYLDNVVAYDDYPQPSSGLDGALDMPGWRQAHIVADIACGIAILALAVWLARASPAPRTGIARSER